MRVRILLFARLRELAGHETMTLEVDEGATIADVWSALARACPAVEPHGRTVSAALNDEYAPLRLPIRDGDEVAFLPPVSGG